MEQYNGQNLQPIDGAIYTLDIETTSLFADENGRYGIFDRTKEPEYYAGRDKIALPYIWMFGVNDTVYYGRDFMDLEKVFKQISCDSMQYIFVHNLSFEFQFLRDILDNHTVSNMICNAIRHPIAFTVDDLNIQFRCTFKLTGLSLAKAAETYTDVTKRVGDLDYNVVRTPRTPLTPVEMGYCEYDIITLYKVVLYFKNKYKRLKWIPYTATGEIRKEFKKRTSYSYRLWCAKMCPDDLFYLKLIKAFQGGMTHGNVLYIGDIIENCDSYDIASSYPYVMLTQKFPMTKFRMCSPERALKLDPDKWAIMFHVKLYNVKSKYLNKYILNSKLITNLPIKKYYKIAHVKADNGRLVSADYIEMYLTEIDYYNIIDAYSYTDIKYIECYSAMKDYAPRELQLYILELFRAKTELRGIPEQEEIYRTSKQHINGLYGCNVTNILKSGCTYTNNDWQSPELTIQYVHDKLEGVRHSRNQCFLYQIGVWITAHARNRLWRVIRDLDDIVVYYDTDSIKAAKNARVAAKIAAENALVLETLDRVAKECDLDRSAMEPVQPNGKKCTIGIWDYEETYKQFKALRAKCYAYISQDDSIHTVIAGVNKKTGYKAIQNLDDFNNNLVFDYDTAGKLTSVYNDNQASVFLRDCNGMIWKNTQKHGIALMPTQYKINGSEEFESYIEEIQTYKNGGWIV